MHRPIPSCHSSLISPARSPRKIRRDSVRAKLREIKVELRQRMHQPIPEQRAWLVQVLRGFIAYHAVPTNYAALGDFRAPVIWLWRRALRRRARKTALCGNG
jgi:RNA-directed DNA polymerase